MVESEVRITLVRHGESVANRAQRWQGQGDSALSDLGRAQAHALGQRLSKRRFDRVVASDLTRAVDTARATGFAFRCDAAFREFDVGRWEGLTREEVEERFPEEIARLKKGEDIPLGGGESYATFSVRVDTAFARLRAELAPGQRAMVVCHGGVIGTLLAGLLGLRGTRRFPLARIANTAISEVAFDAQGAASLHVFNDALHVASVGAWPQRAEVTSCVALVSEGSPHAAYGAFEAHYDAEAGIAALPTDAETGERAEHTPRHLTALLAQLGERHRDQRVAISARAKLIHAWAEDMVWLDAARGARMVAPAEGALCHVARSEERSVLLDYGVSVD